jgi:hypothetical protein
MPDPTPRCAPPVRFLARPASTLPWICALPWLLSTCPAAAQSPTFAFVPSTFQLDTGAKSGEINLVLTATPAVPSAEAPKIVDAGVPEPAPIEVHFKVDSPRKGPKYTLWVVQATASQVPPAISQQRLARVTLGSKEEALVQYTLTNLNPSFKWTVQPPPTTWSLAKGRDIPFAITVGQVKANGVHLVSCSLVEKTNGTPLDCKYLKLCKALNPGDCGQSLQLGAQTAHPLLLRISDDFHEPGSYSGTITVGANEVVDGALPTPMQVTISSTTAWRQWTGVLVILLGIVAAFWVTVYRRNKMLRDQALIPAALLRQKLEDLDAVLEKSPIPADTWKPQQTGDQIKAFLSSLSPQCLADNNYITARFPNPVVTVDTADYQGFLRNLVDSVSVLTAIVLEGFQVVWLHWESANADQRDQIRSVLKAIDGLAAIRGLALSEVQSRIQAFLGQLQDPVRAKVALFSAPQQAQRQAPSLAVVNLDMHRLNLYGWAAWLALTLFAGSVVLILTNPAFGTITDYVQCFLWSFGLAAVGQLTTLNFGTVSSALGISLLKP